MTPERKVQFAAPAWLRDLGFSSWLLVGFVLIIVGVVWLLGQTSTIVMPVVLAAIVARAQVISARYVGATAGRVVRVSQQPAPHQNCVGDEHGSSEERPGACEPR